MGEEFRQARQDRVVNRRVIAPRPRWETFQGVLRMSATVSNQDDPARAGFELWREHAEELVDADSWAIFCQGCGACIPDCPAAKFGTGFDPREIVLKLRYGMTGELLVEHSVLWQCFKCYRCYESCPRPIKPVEMFARLRKMLPELVHDAPPAADEPDDEEPPVT